MKTWVRKTLSVGVLAAGALLFTANGASADAGQYSIDNNGIANGTQVSVPIQIPVNACGDGVGVLGVGVGISGGCSNGAVNDANTESYRTTESATQISKGNDGILNGTQIYAPIQVPINVCGVGVGVLGVGGGISGACTNHAANDVNESARTTENMTQVSTDNNGIGNGTQVAIPVQVPINACGDGVGVLGVGLGLSGGCTNGAVNNVNTVGTPKGGYDHKGTKGTKVTKHAKGTEALPVVGSFTQFVPPLQNAPLVGQGDLPVAGGVTKTARTNVGGVDPLALLG
jgi:hypothetical protein